MSVCGVMQLGRLSVGSGTQPYGRKTKSTFLSLGVCGQKGATRMSRVISTSGREYAGCTRCFFHLYILE